MFRFIVQAAPQLEHVDDLLLQLVRNWPSPTTPSSQIPLAIDLRIRGQTALALRFVHLLGDTPNAPERAQLLVRIGKADLSVALMLVVLSDLELLPLTDGFSEPSVQPTLRELGQQGAAWWLRRLVGLCCLAEHEASHLPPHLGKRAARLRQITADVFGGPRGPRVWRWFCDAIHRRTPRLLALRCLVRLLDSPSSYAPAPGLLQIEEFLEQPVSTNDLTWQQMRSVGCLYQFGLVPSEASLREKLLKLLIEATHEQLHEWAQLARDSAMSALQSRAVTASPELLAVAQLTVRAAHLNRGQF